MSGPGKAIKMLLAHERERYKANELQFERLGSSALWLTAPSSSPPPTHTNVYRPMGDSEILFLVKNNALPATQPYQAIIEGEPGRQYAEKFLTGLKWVDTSPSTCVEFTIPLKLRDEIFAIQHKPEDGALSMGLGDKAGKTLPLFNEALQDGDSTWRIVRVKRATKEKSGGSKSKSHHTAKKNRGQATSSS
eukprot:m.18336 g.18336  ORF g.18336 m.18336 type:complete len:191 (+) comp11818_c0_seq1:16-588(+)